MSDPRENGGVHDHEMLVVSHVVRQSPSSALPVSQDSANITAQWAAGCGAFAVHYGRVLGKKIFNTQGGGELVARWMAAQASSLAGHDVSQLRIKTMVAFCYVEPSCSCPVGDPSFAAFVHKHGPLAVDGQPQVVKAFNGVCSAVPGTDGSSFCFAN